MSFSSSIDVIKTAAYPRFLLPGQKDRVYSFTTVSLTLREQRR